MKKIYSPHDIVKSGLCIGCGSCVGQAPSTGATMHFDNYGQLKPHHKSPWYQVPSRSFSRTCPFSPAASFNEDSLSPMLFKGAPCHDPALGSYRAAYVGHVAEDDFRMQGSSGGLVTWVATELLKKGMVDAIAHVVPVDDPQREGRFFKYQLSQTEDQIRKGAKSRYYPIELSGILRAIREKPGRYAIVGIPCFIKAIQLLRAEFPLFRDRIRYTLGLFCGHMKSSRFIESFAWQMNVPVEKIKSVDFRHKDPARPANWYKARLTLFDGQTVDRDWWHLADGDWGAGFFMNHACNFCDDVMAETADISFGDAWVEPYASDGKGTNVVVVRSAEMESLLSRGAEEKRLSLDQADSKLIQSSQAAGLRQRREGLSYRLTWVSNPLRLGKRVDAVSKQIPPRRKLIYKMRYFISLWSHRMFRLAKALRISGIYVKWAYAAAGIYHALAYHRGKLGKIIQKFQDHHHV